MVEARGRTRERERGKIRLAQLALGTTLPGFQVHVLIILIWSCCADVEWTQPGNFSMEAAGEFGKRTTTVFSSALA
jgi:hypothetical protein